jgi:diguanylate cyclase (GGDEF)-like protein
MSASSPAGDLEADERMTILEEIFSSRILIVDDQLANVKLLEYMLADAGYTAVSTTLDSRVVVKLHQEEPFDLILLDLNMPHMNGFEVIEALKGVEQEGYLSVLVVTAEPAHKIRALQAGAKDFVSKPLDQTELLTRVRNMLEIRLLHKSLRRHNENLKKEVKERSVDLHVAEEKLGYLSHYDEQTGLPNRLLLRDRVEYAQQLARAAEKVMGLLVIDLTRLPLIRGTLGVGVEQLLLAETARRLMGWSRAEESVARIGDDRFAVVTIRQELRDLAEVASELIALLDQPFIFESHELQVEARIGIAAYPENGDHFDVLMQSAEASVRRAMEGKDSRYCFFTPQLNREAQERLKMERELRGALERSEFVLYYQPQLDLRTGRVTAVEALIRWNHPKDGFLSPARFIGLAEEIGLIVPIGEWVLRTACAQMKAWHDQGFGELRVAVNLSARQFSQQNLCDVVRSTLAETGLPAHLLDLELTESLIMTDVENAIGVLKELSELGVQLSIDDFGTGYSSLAYLKRFPLDVLKIDRSFIRDIPDDKNGEAIADAIISMAHSLGIRVMGEGVETEAQCKFLSQNMCDEMQGYLFSEPVSAAKFDELMRESRALPEHLLGIYKPARTLLLVGNEASALFALQQNLQQDGYQILTANNGQAGLALLAQNKVDVIISGQRMPGMTGVEFLRKVRAMSPDISRIVLSEFAELQSVMDAVNDGTINKFFTKPWDDVQLRAQIAEVFQYKEMADENRRLGIQDRASSQALASAHRKLEEVLQYGGSKYSAGKSG